MNNNNELNQILSKFINGVITSFTVDLCSHLISLNFYVEHSAEDPQKHSVAFNDIASFYFVGDYDDMRFNMAAWQYAELSSIYYAPNENIIIHRTISRETPAEYPATSNFVLEIWSAYLFIEAKSVVIDGRHFNVGYPKTDNKV